MQKWGVGLTIEDIHDKRSDSLHRAAILAMLMGRLPDPQSTYFHWKRPSFATRMAADITVIGTQVSEDCTSSRQASGRTDSIIQLTTSRMMTCVNFYFIAVPSSFTNANGRTNLVALVITVTHWLERVDRCVNRHCPDLQHRLWRLTLNGALHLAPLPDGVKSVLDAGTGTGIWAIEFADEHPEATVLGTDLSPIQPSRIPPNYSFNVHDIESDWTFGRSFDFIHLRFLNFGMRNWRKFFRRAFEHLEPGGWLEVHEFATNLQCVASTPRGNPATAAWAQAVQTAAAKIGIDTVCAANFGPMLQEAGFQDYNVVRPIWPIGPWVESEKGQKLGTWARQNFIAGMDGISLAFLTRVEQWTREQIDALLVQVREEMLNPEVHQYLQL